MNDSQQAIDEIHRRIGRNLLRFQEMEVHLKLMLPYIHPDGALKGVEAMKAYQSKNVDGKSLNPLLKQYIGAATAQPGFFEQSVVVLSTARNDLVHNLHKLPGVNLLEPGSLLQLSIWLDEQYKDSEEWYELLRTQSLLILLALMDLNPAVAAEFGVHREKLLAQLPPNVEFINK